MDAKITKKRLGLLLSYDWIKIVGICLAAVMLWILLFTMIATRASSGQTFEIYTYTGLNFYKDELGTLESLQKNNALSNDILDLSTYDLTDDTYKNTILQAHFSAGQGDVMFIADTQDSKNEAGEITDYGDLREFLSGYRLDTLSLDPTGTDLVERDGDEEYVYENFFTLCQEYLEKFFFDESGEPDYENGVLDKQKAESNFRSRIEKDKRYKRESQIVVGVEKEYARLENLREAYCNVKGWVLDESGNSPLSVRTTLVPCDMDGDGKIDADERLEGCFAFDLSNITNLTEILSRPDGGDGSTNVSKDICMTILRGGSVQEPDMRYEAFTFLNYIVKEYAPDKYDAK